MIEAVATKEHRVFGPPGTGKTTYLSRQVARAVEKYGPDKILIASFTKAAAAELLSRKLPVDRSAVGTLHAHCFRAIGGGEIAELHIEDWNKANSVYQLTTESIDIDDPYGERSELAGAGDTRYNEAQNLRAQMVPVELWPVNVRKFFDAWQKWKAEAGLIDFTDMLELALSDVPVHPLMPKVGFFDEAQDFTRLELAVARQWGESMEHFILAGDDDQCIYGFKGASPDAFLDPELPDNQVTVLGQSYRMPAAIFRLAEDWVGKLTSRKAKKYAPRDTEGEVIRTSLGHWVHPEMLVKSALADVEAGKTVMFLAACSYMLVPTVKVLRDAGIPFHNPYRRKRGDWNPLYARRGKSSSERLLAYLAPDEQLFGSDARIWSRAELQMWVDLIDSRSGALPKGAKKRVAELAQVDGHLPCTIDELTEVLGGNEEAVVLAEKTIDRLRWFMDNMLDVKRKVMRYPAKILESRGVRGLTEAPRITVGTIHSVKGGEADCVYLFPDLSMSGMREYVGSPRKSDSVRRQFYVGITRAREKLVITGATSQARVVI